MNRYLASVVGIELGGMDEMGLEICVGVVFELTSATLH